MKKLIPTIILSLILSFCFTLNAQNYDYLESVTATGNGITTNNSQAWTNLFSVTIDVTDISYLLVTASINMRPDGTNTQAREANYNIYRSDDETDESGVIKRQIKSLSGEPDVQSWGVGTLVHIFDVSGLSGNKTYTLEHSNQGGMADLRNVYSSARLTAVALSTEINHHELSNDVKRIGLDATTTTSPTYVAVTGLTTEAITLPINGDIYVSASINGKANGSAVAEYKLEYSTDNGSSWADLGKSIKRSMINTWDDGIVSLVGLLQNQDADNDFKFRVAHKRESGDATVTTHNCNLVAVALAHNGGGYFPSFSSEVGTVGVDIVGLNTAAATVTSASFTAAADIGNVGTSLFVNSQYLVSASGLEVGDRMRAGNLLKVSGASSGAAEEYYRYIPDNDNFGAGGFIGLMEDLVSNGSYTIAMDHQIAAISGAHGTGDEILNTSEVILTGFQTYDQPVAGYWTGASTTAWETAANWADGIIPTSATNVTLYNKTNNPVIGVAAVCKNLDIVSGSVTVSPDYSLTVAEAITNTVDGELVIQSTVDGDGSLIYATGTPNATVQRYVGEGAWHQVAPMTSASTSNDFFIDANNDAWITYHTESTNGWTYIWDLGTTLNRNQGYSYWPTIAKTVNFTGTLTAETQNKTVTLSSSPGEGWNLLGNPFSSALDFASGSWSTTNMEGTIWIWNQTNGNYSYSNKLDGTYNSTGTVMSNGIIPMGQGFFVKARTNDGTIPIPADARVHNTQGLYKESKIYSGNLTHIYIGVTDNTSSDGVFVSFANDATTHMDNGWDVSKLFGNEDAPQLYLMEEGREQSIDHIPLLNEGDTRTIPLYFSAGKDGEQTMNTNNYNFEGLSITIEDLQTEVTQDLKANPVYTFNASQNDDPGRFLLHFTKSPDGIENIQPNTNLHIYAFGQDIYVRSAGDMINQAGELTVYDLSGKIILQQHLQNGELVKVPTSLNNTFAMVKVVKEGAISIQKVTIR